MKKALILLCLLSSCATYKPAKKHDYKKSATVNKSFDKTWQYIVDWLSENNTPIKNIDKASGLITTERNLKVTDGLYYDCGEMGWGQSLTSITGNANIQVKSLDSASSKVVISTFYKGMMINAGATQSFPCDCESRGGLEYEIFMALQN